MNWFIISLVFHVLRLNLCVALSQACPERQYLNSTGVCVDCTVCEELNKKVLRACTSHADAVCGPISNPNIEIPRPKKNDLSNQFRTVNDQAELSKDTNIDSNYYYYDGDTDDDDYDDDDEEGISTPSTKSPESVAKLAKKTNKKATKQPSDTDKKAKLPKPPKYTMFPADLLNTNNISVIDPDTLMQRTKKLKKLKFKDSTIKIDDHLLKIGDTKFKIGDEKNYDGRWLQLSHPHIVDKKIYVDLEGKSVNKKGSTYFSSGEKQTDQEYINEMTKLLNETASLLNEKHPNILNQTTPKSTIADDYDNHEPKNLEDLGDDEDDDEEGDEEDEDSDEDDDEEDDDDYDIEPLPNFVPGNSSDRTDSAEKTDFATEDDYDLLETDFYPDRTYKQLNNNDITAQPSVSSANWQILILVAAMSACLLFFIVVSAYICIFMRKRDFKTTFVADVEDISVRVNLMQHAGFEIDDSIHINNYIKHMRSMKSNDEKLPKIYIRNTEKK